MAQNFRATATLLLVMTSLVLSFSFSSGQADQNLIGYSSIRVRGANTKFTINIKSTTYNFNDCCDKSRPADHRAPDGGKWKVGSNWTTMPELAAGGTGKKNEVTMRCPMERVMKVGAGCVDGLVTMAHNRSGLPKVGRAGVGDGPVVVDPVVVKQCCSVLVGDDVVERMDVNATSDCLCATLKVKGLDLKAYVPLARHLLASCANTTTTTPPPKFTCYA